MNIRVYCVVIHFIKIYDEMNILCYTAYRNGKICMIYIDVFLCRIHCSTNWISFFFSFYCLRRNVSALIKHCFRFLFIVFIFLNSTMLCNSKFWTISKPNCLSYHIIYYTYYYFFDILRSDNTVVDSIFQYIYWNPASTTKYRQNSKYFR